MPNIDDITMLAFVKNEDDLQALRNFANLHQLGEESVFQGDITTATEYLATHEAVRLLIVEIPSAAEAEGLLDKLADVCSPETKVVIVGNINEYSFFSWLQEIGIFHYLLRPITDKNLETMYTKLTAAPAANAAPEKKLGKTVGIIGTRGGSGASSFATLLAGLMAERVKKPIGLVELDPQDGSIALLLDLEPSKGFREAIEKPDRIDGLFLERVMVRATEYLSVLSSEEHIHENVKFTEDAADSLIPILREKFAYTFMDVSHHFNPFSFKALRSCDHIFIITPMNLQGLRDAMRINEWLKERCKITHHQFIGNRVGESEKHEVLQSDFEKSLNAKFTEILPFSHELFSEITNDLNVLKKPQLEGYKQLENIVKIVNPSLKITTEAPAKGKKVGLSILKKK